MKIKPIVALHRLSEQKSHEDYCVSVFGILTPESYLFLI